MKCPRDRCVLVFTDQGLHPRNKCRECNGLLVSREEVLAVIGKAPDADKLAAFPEGPAACPREGATMRRVEHLGVEADVCLECGSVWLDAGELEKVLAQVKKGGRGKARAAASVAGVAGAAALAAAAQPAQAQSVAAQVGQGVAEMVGEVVVDGAIEVAIDLAGDAIGAVIGAIFS